MIDFKRIASTFSKTIDEAGTDIILTNTSNQAYDPAIGATVINSSVSETVRALVETVTSSRGDPIKGGTATGKTEVIGSALRFTFSASDFTPTQSTLVTFDNVVHRVSNIEKVQMGKEYRFYVITASL